MVTDKAEASAFWNPVEVTDNDYAGPSGSRPFSYNISHTSGQSFPVGRTEISCGAWMSGVSPSLRRLLPHVSSKANMSLTTLLPAPDRAWAFLACATAALPAARPSPVSRASCKVRAACLCGGLGGR